MCVSVVHAGRILKFWSVDIGGGTTDCHASIVPVHPKALASWRPWTSSPWAEHILLGGDKTWTLAPLPAPSRFIG